jgi:hypothetical protein
MSASSPARATTRAILTAPLLALAVVWVVLDDLFRSLVVPAVNWVVRLGPLRRLEAWIGRLPPYATLALFVLPLAVIEPFKIYGLFLIGTGHLALGVLAFIAAKVIGIGLAERLFAISRDKLLSIGWFAWAHARAIALRDRVHEALKRTRWWPALMRAVAGLRTALRSAKVRLGGGLRAIRAWVASRPSGPIGRRFDAARRRVLYYVRRRPAASPAETAPPLPKPSRSPS